MWLLDPWIYLSISLVITVHGVHSWGRLLLTSPTRSQPQQPAQHLPVPWELISRRKLLVQLQLNFAISCDKCVVSSTIGSYHHVLAGNQKQCLYCLGVSRTLLIYNLRGGEVSHIWPWAFSLTTYGFQEGHNPLWSVNPVNLFYVKNIDTGSL